MTFWGTGCVWLLLEWPYGLVLLDESPSLLHGLLVPHPLLFLKCPSLTTGCMVTLTFRSTLYDSRRWDLERLSAWGYSGQREELGSKCEERDFHVDLLWDSHDSTWHIADHSPPDCLWAAKGRPEGLGIHVLTQQQQPQFVEIELMSEALAAPDCFSLSWGSASDSGLASAVHRPALPGLPVRSRKWEQGL